MKTCSDRGAALIASFEGWVPRVYTDFAGHKTIGYGHLLTDAEAHRIGSKELSVIEGLDMLRVDLKRFESVLNESIMVSVNQNQYDALLSLVFNIGAGAFKKSTLLRLLNDHDYEGAANQFSVWDKANGKSHPVLTKRRAKEKALFEEETSIFNV